MKYFFTLLLTFALAGLYGQIGIRPVELVRSGKATGRSFSSVDLFRSVPSNGRQIDLSGDFDLLELDENQLQRLIESAPATLTLNLPSTSRSITKVELVKVDLFTEGYMLRVSGQKDPVQVDRGLHYRGVIKGEEQSLAAISFFGQEVMGLVSSDLGNFVLGKMKGSNPTNEHIFYNDQEVISNLGLDCGTEDDLRGYTREELAWSGNGRALTDIVEIYFEVDYDIFLDKGGVANSQNFISGLFNEVATLYANESIQTAISEIFVWNSASPYRGTSSSRMLSDFQAYRNGFNGDLAQLLSYRASGGIAAGFSGLCNSNPDNSMSFSSIQDNYSNFPAYSWTVMVVTHEFGHLFGSRHTHACVWNGNNTAIDACAGSTEGTCNAQLPNPSGGGTIMSYCHLQPVGINFNNGFGTQPGNVIRNQVEAAGCLTGGGNGGDCTENVVTLTLVTDNYPGETTWEVTSGGNTILAGGPYSSSGTTITEEICLPDECYDFTINDSYGDGICCGFGNGSYSLTEADGTVLASGGAFTNSETTNFCVGGSGGGDNQPPTPPTNLLVSGVTESTADLSWGASSDNIGVTGYNVYLNGQLLGSVASAGATITGLSAGTAYSAYVTAFDGAGNGSSASNIATWTTQGGAACTPGTLSSNSFETGTDGWNSGGGDAGRTSNSRRSYDGNFSFLIRDNSGAASSFTSPSYDFSGLDQVEIEFYFYPNSMENGEDFWVRYNDGSGWQTVATYTSGSSFNNNQFYVSTVTLDATEYNLSSNAQIRFQCDASANADRVYIDQVTVTGVCNGANLYNPTEPQAPVALGETAIENSPGMNPNPLETGLESAQLFPNPTTGEINLNFKLDMDREFTFDIFDRTGRHILRHAQEVTVGENRVTLDLDQLAGGMYLVRFGDAEAQRSMRFIKKD